MIFQLGIQLNVENKDVQATLDLDTGLVGFVEKSGSEYSEYHYFSAPIEFKKALVERLVEHAAEKSYGNLKISRKSELAAALTDFSKRDQSS